MTHTPLNRLVRQLLLAKTDGLDARSLAAYLDGWTGALSLLERPEICLPDAPPEVRKALTQLTAEIKHAQTEVLDD